ncbi:Protochlorophyllide-dependent translocon component 52, chloroplastic, partial [Linum perenne]
QLSAMEALTSSSAFLLPSRNIPNSLLLHAHFSKPNLYSKSNLFSRTTQSKFKLCSASPVSVDQIPNNHVPLEHVNDKSSTKFDWYAQWYPVMAECDLDKRVPHGTKVMGIDVVVWWDKKQNAWKVFDDMCPHRLAPLSEGRIDPSGRLQCVYHGWCFDGSGSCKLIPQAPVHTNKRACVAAYPTAVQHGIVWFWPNSDPQYKSIIEKKKPPFISELDDPSFTKVYGFRDLPYGYELLIENLADPVHVTYVHYGLVPSKPPTVKRDVEGGRPVEFVVTKESIDGYDADVDYGRSKFTAPCILSIPVSPGKSRLIWAFPRNFNTWIDKVVPPWVFHLSHNTVLDSDLSVLHVEEQRIKSNGGNRNWHKACFVPTKADALVVGFRRWYWNHVVNCRSCNKAYKGFKALETFLLVSSVGLIAIVAAAATKEGMMLASLRTPMAIMAMICFAVSRWLAHFVYTNFRYHDYNNALPRKTPFYRISKLSGIAQ